MDIDFLSVLITLAFGMDIHLLADALIVLPFGVALVSLIIAIRTESKTISYIKSLQFLLPPRNREEFRGDITEIYNTLKEEGKSRIRIYLILLLIVINLCWSGFLFKYNEFFGMEKGETEVR